MPWILPTSSEKLALAKALLSIPITISPGATKSAKATVEPPTCTSLRPPSATVKMTRYRSVVIAGAQTVCSWTLKNRRTSFTYKVFRPPQFTLRIDGTPGALLIKER